MPYLKQTLPFSAPVLPFPLDLVAYLPLSACIIVYPYFFVNCEKPDRVAFSSFYLEGGEREGGKGNGTSQEFLWADT